MAGWGPIVDGTTNLAFVGLHESRIHIEDGFEIDCMKDACHDTLDFFARDYYNSTNTTMQEVAGGPLVCGATAVYWSSHTLVGILSATMLGFNKTWSMYMHVPAYKKWIKQMSNELDYFYRNGAHQFANPTSTLVAMILAILN